jgi:hypothetical protein
VWQAVPPPGQVVTVRVAAETITIDLGEGGPGLAVPQEIRPTFRFGVTVLNKLDVHPHHAQVALVDATWQDYPQWETGDEHVVFRAASLTDPDNPPYPGFAVATAHRPRDGRLLRHRNHDDDLRSRVARRETGRAAEAGEALG